MKTLNTAFHFKRARISKLLMEAARFQLVVVCAGAGYGKTSAVHDFAEEYQATTAWLQFSERDNVSERFWENFSHTQAQVNAPLAKASVKLGFPDTEEKLKQYHAILRDHVQMKRRIIVMDDFHCINEPSVIRFLEECVFLKLPPGTTVFLITRSTPNINVAGLETMGKIFNISEDDLRFTDNELAQYFRQLNFTLQPDSLHEIMQDTEGWAFAIQLIARSYQKAPSYAVYLRNAMKSNIFRLMETEIWDGISKSAQEFLVRLSMIEHLSTGLISLLAGSDEDLISELEKQNAYVRRDSYIDAYLIHPLFLEFLATKQKLLPEDKKTETYRIAAQWCKENDFYIDALSYYEKIDDYSSIVFVFFELPPQIPQDIARYAAQIFERAPESVFDSVDYLSIMHLRCLMCQGLCKESIKLAEHYEAKFLKLPADSVFKKRSLSGLYFTWAFLRGLMCVIDDKYDFDIYFEKFFKYASKPVDMRKFTNYCPGPWINCAGSSRKGSPDECIEALNRSAVHASRFLDGSIAEDDKLARGELKFYQGAVQEASPLIAHALAFAKGIRLFEIEHRSLFYSLRMAVFLGDYPKTERIVKEIKAQLDENEYTNRYTNYDITMAWFYCFLDLPENAPDWLKDSFAPYDHAGFIENFANQMKARYCYATRNYQPLLTYINEMKQRESFLFGRAEMLAIEACAHYKMKNRKKAFASLLEAYQTASPNGLLMPFIELGKDMRTLTASALKEKSGKIPRAWLEEINRKAASYAKRRTHIINEYKQTNQIEDAVAVSPREAEILSDLSHGLSRAEIAAGRGISINTVKMVINNIYVKLGAENIADAIRIATEAKIL